MGTVTTHPFLISDAIGVEVDPPELLTHASIKQKERQQQEGHHKEPQ
jgi:hypothetical protein